MTPEQQAEFVERVAERIDDPGWLERDILGRTFRVGADSIARFAVTALALELEAHYCVGWSNGNASALRVYRREPRG